MDAVGYAILIILGAVGVVIALALGAAALLVVIALLPLIIAVFIGWNVGGVGGGIIIVAGLIATPVILSKIGGSAPGSY
jgi:hypothetical protein